MKIIIISLSFGYNHALPIFTTIHGQQVALGATFTCAITGSTGTIRCWGGNFANQLSSPAGGNYLQIAAGAAQISHACAVAANGQVTCWGENTYGQANSPAGNFIQIANGYYHTCAITAANSIYCWGRNDLGQLSSPTGSYSDISCGREFCCSIAMNNGAINCWGYLPNGLSIIPPGQFIQLSAGYNHVCALKISGVIICFGDNTYGQGSPPANLLYVQVSVGLGHTCAIQSGGTVICFGSNDLGQTVAPAGQFSQLDSGEFDTCGIEKNVGLICWGNNYHLQAIPPKTLALQIVTGVGHSCGIYEGNIVKCWGSNGGGQTSVPAGKFLKISSGQVHNCGLLIDNSVICWGQADYGKTIVPKGIGTCTDVSAGWYHTCAIKSDSKAVCWGLNDQGQSTPSSAQSFIRVTAGGRHSCGILSSTGNVLCWGDNSAGQLNAPVGVFTAISAGLDQSCGILSSGAGVCWGQNWGSPPVGNFLEISCSFYHSCGIKDNQVVVCWGYSSFGQDQAPAGFFLHLSAGNYHTCGINLARDVICWGLNLNLQGSAPFYSLMHSLTPSSTYRRGILTYSCSNGGYSNTDGAITALCTGFCDPGYYGNQLANQSTCTGECSQGHYCMAGTVNPVPCPPSVFGAVTGLTTNSCTSKCPIGFYCLQATINSTQYPCPAGRYGSTEGLTSAQCSGICPASYYCPKSTVDPLQFICPAALFYCPAGSALPIVVQPGNYSSSGSGSNGNSDGTGMSQTLTCNKGQFCLNGIATNCSLGRFSNYTSASKCESCTRGKYALSGWSRCDSCNAGYFTASIDESSACTACAIGTYTSSAGYPGLCIDCPLGYASLNNSASTSCVPCPPAYYCPKSSSIHTASPCLFANQYCPGNTSTALTVANGYYSVGGLALDGSLARASALCMTGSSCVGGIKSECPAGRYSAINGSTACLSCAEGSHSIYDSGSTYCVICSPGYFCPAGSSFNTRLACASASQHCPGNSTMAMNVPANYYSIGGSQSDGSLATAIALCKAGYACSGGISTACVAGKYSLNSSSSCLDCAAGSASLYESASPYCMECPSGQFCPKGASLSSALSCSSLNQFCPGNTSIALLTPQGRYAIGGLSDGTLSNDTLSCTAGSYCIGGIRTLCSPGQYSNQTGASKCDLCVLGRFSNVSGSNDCYTCALGQSTSIAGSSSCIGCSAGRFSINVNGGNCQDCTQGKISGPNAITCIDCAPGYYTLGAASVSCVPCSGGSIAPSSGWPSLCQNCESGSYSESASSKCILANPGQSVPSRGAAFYQLCPIGTYSAGNGSSVCMGCVPGRYSDSFGAASCSQCPIGTATRNNFSSSCTPCERPSVPINGGTACSVSNCKPGQGDDAQGNCYLCPVNTFSSGSGAICQPCPTNSYAPARGAFSCISCADLTGVNCASGSAVINSGYWGYLIVNRNAYSNIFPATTISTPSISLNPMNNSSSIIAIRGRIEIRAAACPIRLCTGGQTLGLDLALDPNEILSTSTSATSTSATPGEYNIPSGSVVVIVTQGSSSSNQICSPSRDPSPSNTLCGSCTEGRVEWNGDCVDCPKTKGDLLFALILFSFVYVHVLYRLSQTSNADGKILIYYIQTAIFQLGPFDQYLSWLGLINFSPTQATGENCVTPLTPYQRLAMSALIPVFFMLLLLIMMSVHWIWNRYIVKKLKCVKHRLVSSTATSMDTNSVVEPFPFQRYTRTIASLLLFTYLQIATSCIRYLRCINVNGRSIVFSAPAIDCDSDSYKSWLSLVVILLIVEVCLFPLLMMLFLWRNRSAIQSRNPQFRASYGILFESYASHAFYWQPLVLIRQVILISLDVAYQADHSSKYLAFCYFNLFVFCLNATIKPNARPIENKIESISHLLLVIMVAKIGFHAPPYTIGEQVFIVLVVIPFAIGLALLVGFIRLPLPYCKQMAIKLGMRESVANSTTTAKNTKSTTGPIPPLADLDNINPIELQEVNHTAEFGSNLAAKYIHQHKQSYSQNPVLTTIIAEDETLTNRSTVENTSID